MYRNQYIRTSFIPVMLLFCLAGNPVFAQIKNIGLPFITNYSKNTYNGGTQNWDITQDSRGFIYIGNNDGVLEFDGSSWRTYRLGNGSVVRSVCHAADKRVYTGAFNEFGYLEQNAVGKMEYRSLVGLIPPEFRNFDEIWKIYQTSFGMVFQSFYAVFIYHNNRLDILKPFSTFGFSYYCNNKYYIMDREKGLLTYVNGKLIPLYNNPDIFSESEMRFILPYEGTQLLIGILNKGVYVFDGKNCKPWSAPVNSQLLRNQIFSAISLDRSHYAFGSIQDGVYITDTNGIILQHINRAKGLQNNTVLSLFSDRVGNMWMGLDNGISYVEVKSPLTYFNYCYGIETGYASIVHNGILYFGTNQGLFGKRLSELTNSADNELPFTLINGTQGQVWNLTEVDGQLLCGHNSGTFVIDGFSARKLSGVMGGWTFVRLSNHKDLLVGGTYSGLVLFKKLPSGQWAFYKKIVGFNESSKVIIENVDHSLWISHGYKGIFRLELNKEADSVVNYRLFTENDGLVGHLPYNIIWKDGHILTSTDKGLFEYNEHTRKFTWSASYNSFFGGNNNLLQLIPDASNNYWYFVNRKLGVYRLLEDGTYKDIFMPFMKFNNSLVHSFEHLYPYDSKNVFIGVQDGFIHYNPAITKDYFEPYGVFIREIKLLKRKPDSILWYMGNNNVSSSDARKKYRIPYKDNSLSFMFSAPFYENPEKTEYRCRLSGFDTSWSAWGSRTLREYTNLHEGNYVFEVQARNIYLNESTTDQFAFSIAPPFYRSRFAYYVYILLFISVVVGNLMYFRKRIENTRRREKLLHEKKMIAREQQFQEESLIAEKEIDRLKNEKLTSEIKHKNKELANSTMNLIQKNKFLTLVKNELNGVIAEPSDDTQKSKIRGLVKRIDRDLNNEKYFKVFDTYFDEVHQDFLTRMKETHPDLSPKELRLCAYLRMNISTKEISTLMNISVRGVEVSRYRLRKKLNIDRDVNLTDYILKF